MKLEESFYQRGDVVKIARELLGKYIFTSVRGKITAGMITETEAYAERERACHAFKGKTKRNEVLFEAGGHSYVYLCYGIHNLFNVVTNEQGSAEAVLIRAVEPKVGAEYMMRRMKTKSLRRITCGPGKLTKALGIDRKYNGKLLWGDDLWLEQGEKIRNADIIASPRIGVDYAGEDALLPWRFTIRGNEWVSK